MDFYSMIKDVYGDGYSFEEIAEMFTNSLNEFEKEQEQKNEVMEYLNIIEDEFMEHFEDSEALTARDAALFWISCVASHEELKDKTIEEIDEIIAYATKVINGIMTGYKAVKKLDEASEKLANQVNKIKIDLGDSVVRNYSKYLEKLLEPSKEDRDIMEKWLKGLR